MTSLRAFRVVVERGTATLVCFGYLITLYIIKVCEIFLVCDINIVSSGR